MTTKNPSRIHTIAGITVKQATEMLRQTGEDDKFRAVDDSYESSDGHVFQVAIVPC